MKKFVFLLAIFTIITPFSSDAQSLPIFGNWAREDGIARVNISRCDDNFCARNIWIRPGWKAERVGDVLVMDINERSPSLYVGRAYDPQRSANYTFRLEIQNNSMETRGCILGGVVCKSIGWRRL